MPHRLLIIVKKEGLSHNLLRLALGGLDLPADFVDPKEVSQALLRKFTHIIVDDNSISSFQELKELLGPVDKEKKVIYLSKESVEIPKSPGSWLCLRKPINPQELKAIFDNPRSP
jgi:hypothetical protein